MTFAGCEIFARSVQVEAVMTDIRRSITLMLGLQNAVNALLDSTTADGSNTTPVRVSDGFLTSKMHFQCLDDIIPYPRHIFSEQAIFQASTNCACIHH